MTMEPKTTSLVQAVSDALRERILTGEIGAGQALTEQGIATQADVARPTAKAALERLTHEGLSVTRPAMAMRSFSRCDQWRQCITRWSSFRNRVRMGRGCG